MTENANNAGRRTAFQSVFGAVTVVFALFTAGCWDSYTFSPTENDTIEIGALVPLSGPNSGAGLVHLAAMETAIEDANVELASHGVAVRLSFGDTQSDPLAASVLLNTFLLRNQRIVIGPNTSAEVGAVAHDIGSSGSLLISPSSTSLSLSNRNDHIFRLAPNDAHLAEKLVDFLWEQGHRLLVLIHRNDIWGNSLAAEMEREFTAAGGTTISSHAYDSFETEVVDSILKLVQEDITTYGGGTPFSEIALQLSCMSECAAFIRVALDSVPLLRNIGWYGSDGFVNDPSVTANSQLAEFASQANFTSPIYRVDVPNRYWDVIDRIESRVGVTPGSYSLLSYDAVRVAARTLARVGRYASYEELEAMLAEEMAYYDGVSGGIDLDIAGDRDGGEYDFYAVRGIGMSYAWVRVH